MREIKNHDEYIDAIADYIMRLMDWEIPFENRENGLLAVLSIVEERIAWFEEIFEARREYLNKQEHLERNAILALLKKQKEAYLRVKEPEY